MRSGVPNPARPRRTGRAARRSRARTAARSTSPVAASAARRARRAALATYAFCRIADDIVDAAGETGPSASAVALGAVGGAGRASDAIRSPSPSPQPAPATAFRSQPVHDLLTGIRMDLSPGGTRPGQNCRDYCYHVAGTVGLMVAPILGCRDPRRAHARRRSRDRDAADEHPARRGRGCASWAGSTCRSTRWRRSAAIPRRSSPAGQAGRFPDLMAFQIDAGTRALRRCHARHPGPRVRAAGSRPWPRAASTPGS